MKQHETAGRKAGLAAILACVLFWGFSFVSTKIVTAVFPPVSTGAIRFAAALVFLFVIKQAIAPGEKLRLADLPLLAGAGLTGVTLYFFFENNGVVFISASEAAIFIGAIPVLTMAAEFFFGGKSARSGSLRRALGAVLSMAGVYLVSAFGVPAAGTELAANAAAPHARLLGCLCMAGAAVSWVVYSFLTRPLFSRCSRIHIVFWQSFFGFLGFLPFALAEIPRWGAPSAAVIVHMAFLAILCSALGYWFYALALEKLGATVSAIFVNFIPVVTAVGGFFVLGERLAPLQLAGAALVIGGVSLAMFERK